MAPKFFTHVEDRYPSGESFYRSLARQIHGNPDHVDYIRAAVHDHFLRLWTQASQTSPAGVLAGGYKNYVRNFEDFVGRDPWAKESCAKSFIGGLQCPDLVLCGCVPGSNRESLAKAFLAVISAALQIKIVLC
jgi:hypothetical protein